MGPIPKCYIPRFKVIVLLVPKLGVKMALFCQVMRKIFVNVGSMMTDDGGVGILKAHQ